MSATLNLLEQGRFGVRSRNWMVTDVSASKVPPDSLQNGSESPQHLLSLSPVRDNEIIDDLQSRESTNLLRVIEWRNRHKTIRHPIMSEPIMPELIPISSSVHYNCAFDIHAPNIVQPMATVRLQFRQHREHAVAGGDLPRPVACMMSTINLGSLGLTPHCLNPDMQMFWTS